MKIPSDPLKRTLLSICLLILLFSVLKWSFPILKIFIALAVAVLAWHCSGDSSNEKTGVCSGIHEIREENGVHIRRHVFSSASLDLTDASLLPEKIELQCAFSSLFIRLPVDANITLHASGAFCSIKLPGQSNILFGENTVRCGSQDPLAPCLFIDLNCAFSSARFRMG